MKNVKELEELEGVVERINRGEPTYWSSPLHLVPKPDGSLRPVGDYRALNDMTTLDTYPLPNLRHFTDRLAGAKVFSHLDLQKTYHLIPLDEESQTKSTILSPFGAFKFERLAMGMKNSGQSFQKLADAILVGMEEVFCYMDDLLIFSKDEDSHLATLKELFTRLQSNGLAKGLDKCTFGVHALDFLGYRVNTKGITPLPRKLEAISAFPKPDKPKHLLGFLGALYYYRRSYHKVDGKNPAEILQPLYTIATKKLTTDAFKKQWQEQNLDVVFNQAKQLLINVCQLAHPNPNAPISLTTDASQYAIGGVLEQFDQNEWQPLGFWSRHLKPDKQKWTTFRRELLAIKEAMRHFHTEIQGRHVVIFTDHKALLGAFKSPTSLAHDPIASNHIMEVSQYTNDIRFIAGKSNAVADWLSRPPEVPLGAAYQLPPPAEINSIQQVAMDLFISPESIVKEQIDCPNVKSHQQGKHPPYMKLQWKELQPGVKVYCDVTSPNKPRPLLPKAHREVVLHLYHGLNHPGQRATYTKVARQYYWPAMRKDISTFVKQCHHCQRVKSTNTIVPKFSHRPVQDKRFKDLMIDVVGPLVASEGMKYILTVLDRTTRWIEAFLLPEATAQQCCMAFIRGLVQRFGLPKNATSDNGSTFVSNLWADLNAAIGIKSITPLHTTLVAWEGWKDSIRTSNLD